MFFAPSEQQSWRNEWPICQEKIYVNHAAVSPFSNRVRRVIEEWVGLSTGPEVADFDRFVGLKENVRQLAGRIFHADPRHVAFIKNTSDGLSILTASLAWKPGDRIIVPDCEFPSNLYPFLHCRRFGVEVDVVPMHEQTVRIADIERRITSRTRLISTSFVQFHNGFRQDLHRLGQICHDRGIILCVDSIQGLGAVPFHAEDWKIDFASNGGHKWLMAPAGLGLMYIAPSLLDQLDVTRLGWLSVKDPWTFDRTTFEFEDGPRRFETGNENWLGLAGMQASLAWLLDIGVEKIHAHTVSLLDRLIDQIMNLPLEIISPLEPTQRSGILSFRLNEGSTATERLHTSLTEHHIACSLRKGAIRISPHFYNTPDEMDQIAANIREHVT